MGITLLEDAMDSNIVSITDHAYERGKERLGLNKKALIRMSERVYSDGLRLNDITGSLYKYLSEKMEYEPYEKTLFRVYGEMIFVYTVTEDVFFGDVHPLLVTVMCVPNDLKKQAKGNFRKMRA